MDGVLCVPVSEVQLFIMENEFNVRTPSNNASYDNPVTVTH